MTVIPEPPVPADADLRHMPGYMLDVQSLLGSDLAALGDPAANWFALLTWCAAFHQVPAGSLPDDAPTLAYLVRLGRDVRTWKKMREKGAMRGWEKHSDGRLYHPVVTKTVLSLLGKSRAGKTAAQAKIDKKNGQTTETIDAGNNDRSTNVAKSLQQETNNRREGKGIEGKGREDSALGQEADYAPGLPTVIDQTMAPKRTRSGRRTALDLAWMISEDLQQYARERGWSDPVIDQQFEKFKNFHHGKGNLMASWPSAWRTWVGNGYDVKSGRTPTTMPSRADSAIEGMFSDLKPEDFNERTR